MTKRCTKCKVEKAESEFYKMKAGKDGLCSHCKSCRSEYNRKEYAKDPGKKLRAGRKWNEANPEKRLASNRKCAKNNRLTRILCGSRCAAKREGHIPCNATIEELKASQTGRCFICGVPEIECSKKLAMDHDHETGEFRGWLCKKCNTALGLFGDNEELLIDAVHYLMAHQHRK